MTETTTDADKTAGSWGELLGPRYGPVSIVLAGGVLLEATNVYVTTSLLPTIVGDIGGDDYYAWTMTVFLTASIVTAMLVSRVLTTRGSVAAYVWASTLFGLGSLICALSPSMAMFLVGRGVQGLGGGLLAGLGYALIQRAFPERLWARAAALVSAMWGVGNILGPSVGGVFAELDAWQPAFLGLTALAAVLVLMIVRHIPRTEREAPDGAVPGVSLVLLTAAVASVSIASIVPAGLATVATLAAGVGLVAWFLAHERRADSTVLPRVTFALGSRLRWVYLTVGVLAFGIGTEAFIPLFGQELGRLSPLYAGFMGAVLSLGWAVVQMFSAHARRVSAVRSLIVVGPLVLAAGLAAYGLTQAEQPSAAVVAVWFVALFVAGSGIGLAFPHLTVAALGSVREEEEAAKAAAGVSTVFIVASALSAALAGVLVNLGEPSLLASARYLLGAFTVVALVGILPAMRATASVREGVQAG